ncbi:uncharacterized protein LOC132702840 [Cylas formicarius]|uniref:uncharacterized protein LOC132702840 n=1 Tax=Cylas formicarius TaxID=197179 RepID=UPI0029584FBE|nr:uncharacterized protein LOC132702840 [Cylas formicarius]
MNVIQVYAPTADKDDQEVEMFYEQINEILKQVKAKDVTIIMGDLNAKVGKGKTNNLMGNFGLGERNDRETRERVKNKINGALQTLQCIENNNEEHINNNWLQFKTEILKTCKEQLSKKTEVRKEWMTTEILGLMDERRTYKNKDQQKYRYLQSKIRSKIREAKENWHREKCEEIEKLQSKHDGFNAHKRIKELTNKRNYNNNLLVDENGDIMDTKEKLKVWKNYVEQLYEDQRDEESSEYICDDIGPEITKDEVEHIIKEMKTGKATGLDEIPAEVLKLIDNHNIHLLTHLFNSVYKTGILPKEWLQSTFITIPKKTNARQCSDHRTISLMCHILKVLLKINHRRIYKKLEIDIEDTQFGFRNGLGTREALFAFNVLTQRCLDVNQDVLKDTNCIDDCQPSQRRWHVKKKMPLKVPFLDFHVDFLPENLGAVSDERICLPLNVVTIGTTQQNVVPVNAHTCIFRAKETRQENDNF